VYSYGGSEEIVGRAIERFASRDAIVLATQVRMPMGGLRSFQRKTND
jgi:1-deoxyxylulose-5-phosphate synthase